jgi:hypothetical protein
MRVTFRGGACVIKSLYAHALVGRAPFLYRDRQASSSGEIGTNPRYVLELVPRRTIVADVVPAVEELNHSNGY